MMPVPCMTCGRTVIPESERSKDGFSWATEEECYSCFKARSEKRTELRQSGLAKLGLVLTKEEIEALGWGR